MVVEEFIHVVFYESNNSLQGKESVDDDVGLNFSMGRLQIEDEILNKKMRWIQRMKNNHLWHFPHFLN